MKQFYSNLCDVHDLVDQRQVTMYIESTELTTPTRVFEINELYLLQQLMLRHHAEIITKDDQDLYATLRHLGDVPHQPSGGNSTQVGVRRRLGEGSDMNGATRGYGQNDILGSCHVQTLTPHVNACTLPRHLLHQHLPVLPEPPCSFNRVGATRGAGAPSAGPTHRRGSHRLRHLLPWRHGTGQPGGDNSAEGAQLPSPRPSHQGAAAERWSQHHMYTTWTTVEQLEALFVCSVRALSSVTHRLTPPGSPPPIPSPRWAQAVNGGPSA